MPSAGINKDGRFPLVCRAPILILTLFGSLTLSLGVFVQVILCSSADILEAKNPGRICDCVHALTLLESHPHVVKRAAPSIAQAGTVANSARTTAGLPSTTRIIPVVVETGGPVQRDGSLV